MANGLNDLKDLMDQATKAPEGEQKVINEGAGAGNGDGDKGTKKTRVPKEVKDQSTLFQEHNVGAGNLVPADSVAGKLMKVNSKIAQIAGFIVPNSPRIEIVVSRNKVSKKDEPERYETRVNVKERFSQQIKGIVLNHSPELVSRINEEKSARGTTPMTGEMSVMGPDGQVINVARKSAEVFEQEAGTLLMATKILGYEAFISWMLDYCWYEIQEAPAIFWSHKENRTVTKDGVKTTFEKQVSSVSDLKPSQKPSYILAYKFDEVRARYEKRVAESAGKTTAKGNKVTVKAPTLKDVYPLSSKYRGRKLAVPGNFIAMKKFEHTSVKGSYTPEEQAEMNKKYIREGFSVNNAAAFSKKLESMTAESKERVTIDANGDVTASQFFAANNSLVANKEYLSTISRWWGKVDTLSDLDMKLVAKSPKEVPASRDGSKPAYTKYELNFIQFGKVGNQLTNPEYKAIVSATDGRLTDSDVTTFISSLSASTGKNTNVRQGINYDVSVASSADILSAIAAMSSAYTA